MYDMNNIKKLARIAPDAMRGFEAFDAAALKKGAIPRKYKELMALAIALTTQCPYCLEIHKGAAINAGATKEELGASTVYGKRYWNRFHYYVRGSFSAKAGSTL